MKIIKQTFLASLSLGISLVYPGDIQAIGNPTIAHINLGIKPQPMGIKPHQLAQAKPKNTVPKSMVAKNMVLALDSNGLRVVNSSTGSTKALSFGMKENDVVLALTNLRGKPRDRGTNQECGAGALAFAKWTDGLNLWFAKGRFVGWIVDGRSKGANSLTTIAGIGTGSTRTQLNKVYTVKVSQSTLGTEFSAGELGGLLSGNKPSDRVTTLWSGTTCLFR